MGAPEDAPSVLEDVPEQPICVRCPFRPARPRPPIAAAPDDGVSSTPIPVPREPQRRVVVWLL